MSDIDALEYESSACFDGCETCAAEELIELGCDDTLWPTSVSVHAVVSRSAKALANPGTAALVRDLDAFI